MTTMDAFQAKVMLAIRSRMHRAAARGNGPYQQPTQAHLPSQSASPLRTCTLLAHYVIPTPAGGSAQAPQGAQARSDWLLGLNTKDMERTLFRRFDRADRQAATLLQNELQCLAALAADPRERAVDDVDGAAAKDAMASRTSASLQRHLSLDMRGALSLATMTGTDSETDSNDSDSVVDVDVDGDQDLEPAAHAAAPAAIAGQQRARALLRVPSVNGASQIAGNHVQQTPRIQVPTVPVSGVLGVSALLEDAQHRFVVFQGVESGGSCDRASDVDADADADAAAALAAAAAAAASNDKSQLRGLFTDLQSVLHLRRGLQEHEARPLFRRIVEIVADMHKHGVVHRDLKISNVLLTKASPSQPQSDVKIRDFRFSSMLPAQRCTKTDRVVFDDRVTGIIGAPAYLAPEILGTRTQTSAASIGGGYPLSLQNPDMAFDLPSKTPLLGDSAIAHTYSGFAADMYALGVLLFVMLVGSYPFTASTPTALLDKIVRRDRAPIPDFVPLGARQVLEALLSENPVQRPSADALLQRFDWVAGSQMQPVSSSPFSSESPVVAPQAPQAPPAPQPAQPPRQSSVEQAPQQPAAAADGGDGDFCDQVVPF